MNKREIGKGFIKSAKVVTKYVSAVSLALVVPFALGIALSTLTMLASPFVALKIKDEMEDTLNM